MIHPVPQPVVQDEDDARGHPRDGVAQQRHVQRVVERHHGKLPDHAQKARAREHDDHGPQALTRAADGPGDVVVERVDHVEGADVPHNLRRQLGNLWVVHEEPGDAQHVGHEHDGGGAHHQRGQAERTLEAPAHAPVVARAEVLGGERGHGHAQGLGDHPDDGIDAPAQAKGRHHRGAKGVDGGLRDDVGDRVAGGLQAQWKAAAQHDAADAGVYAKPAQVKAPGTVHVREAHQRERAAPRQGERRGHARASRLHVHPRNKYQVKHDVNHAGGGDDNGGRAGVPHGALHG